jgi:hypothetical protein
LWVGKGMWGRRTGIHRSWERENFVPATNQVPLIQTLSSRDGRICDAY